MIGIALVSVALGFFGASFVPSPAPETGIHTMPDGTVMQNATMHGAMQGMTANMQGKTGDALDKVFLEDMIVHHEGAIEMAEILLANTQRPELKMLGENIISAQTGEVEIMRGWLEAWF